MPEVTSGVFRTVKSGDLLVWDEANHGFWGKLVIKFIRFMTMSEYGHVGIAVVEDGYTYVLEAVQPRVQYVSMSGKTNFYVVSMNLDKTEDLVKIAKKYVGYRYSLLDCVRGYLGLTTLSDERWQCAELTAMVYEDLGVELVTEHMTPSGVVRAALSHSGSTLWVY